MNSKLAKRLRKIIPDWNKRSYIQDTKLPLEIDDDAPQQRPGFHTVEIGRDKEGKKVFAYVVNPIRLHPTCGRKVYKHMKRRVNENPVH